MARKTLEEKLKSIDEQILKLQEQRKEVVQKIEQERKELEEKQMKALWKIIKGKNASFDEAEKILSELLVGEEEQQEKNNNDEEINEEVQGENNDSINKENESKEK